MTWVRCDGFRGAGRILVLDPLLPLVSVVGSGGIVPRLLAVVRSAAGSHVSVPSRELVSPLIRRVGRGPVCRRLRRDYNGTNLYSSGLVGPL